jgi:hypothetical protein
MSFFLCLSASNPKNMTNLKRKSMKNMVFLPCLVASTPEKMTNWNRKSPRMISDYEEVDEDLSSEVPNINDKEVDYVDFCYINLLVLAIAQIVL